jgi:hypothetical protein
MDIQKMMECLLTLQDKADTKTEVRQKEVDARAEAHRRRIQAFAEELRS